MSKRTKKSASRTDAVLVADEVRVIGPRSQARRSAVELSNRLVELLSTQLYRTPVKAIEELVINSYDAHARRCLLAVPAPEEVVRDAKAAFVAVWDDGEGMDADGLVSLWLIGSSDKRAGARRERSDRKQIGKFGIGKLATYSIARRVTYLSKSSDEIHGVTINYEDFAASSQGATKPVPVQIVALTDWSSFRHSGRFSAVIERLGLQQSDLDGAPWTMAILEDLKPKAAEIRIGRLGWVLRTAMPLASNFQLLLNGEEIRSSKQDYSAVVEFDLVDLPEARLANLLRETGERWRLDGESLVCDKLPSGVTGKVVVYDRSLLGGKSDDVGRSHGFFVRVRGRLLNEDDPLFGLGPLSFQTFNRFRADVAADDLDSVILSSREEVENSPAKDALEALLRAIFNEARSRLDEHEDDLFAKETTKVEAERQFVAPRLVERPLADVLASDATRGVGADADRHWFYLKTNGSTDLTAVLDRLYGEERERYHYKYEKSGRTGRMVQFDPGSSTFTLNEDHEFVRAYQEEPASQRLLHDIVTAEVMLEVYLREARVYAEIVGEVLERRDLLLKGLARDHLFSFAAIAAVLRDAAADQYDLEVALVRAARSLGFVAKHIGGAGEPDGIARLISHPEGERKITLEAKSSKNTPNLNAIDFAGLARHVQAHGCTGCLLVAPSFPGTSKGVDSAAAVAARNQRISCWTIDVLARVVEHADARHITARQIIGIVTERFAPDDVSQAVDKLLGDPAWTNSDLHFEILAALRRLQNRLPERPRSVEMIATEVSAQDGFERVSAEDIRNALAQLAGASKGGIILTGTGETVVVNVALDELANRLAARGRMAPTPRGRGGFLASNAGEEGAS